MMDATFFMVAQFTACVTRQSPGANNKLADIKTATSGDFWSNKASQRHYPVLKGIERPTPHKTYLVPTLTETEHRPTQDLQPRARDKRLADVSSTENRV